jgi:hypothetical protein
MIGEHRLLLGAYPPAPPGDRQVPTTRTRIQKPAAQEAYSNGWVNPREFEQPWLTRKTAIVASFLAHLRYDA